MRLMLTYDARAVAFLDPPAPEHLPRGVVTWPLFGATALGHVVFVMRAEAARGVLAIALAAQVLCLVIAAYTSHRLFATGATRRRVIRIIALGAMAAVSATVTGVALRSLTELACAVLALAIAARAIAGLRLATPVER
jgi:hypothetical protein